MKQYRSNEVEISSEERNDKLWSYREHGSRLMGQGRNDDNEFQ